MKCLMPIECLFEVSLGNLNKYLHSFEILLGKRVNQPPTFLIILLYQGFIWMIAIMQYQLIQV